MRTKLYRKPRSLFEIKTCLVDFSSEIDRSNVYSLKEAELISKDIIEVGGKLVPKDTSQWRRWLRWCCNEKQCTFEISWKREQDSSFCRMVHRLGCT